MYRRNRDRAFSWTGQSLERKCEKPHVDHGGACEIPEITTEGNQTREIDLIPPEFVLVWYFHALRHLFARTVAFKMSTFNSVYLCTTVRVNNDENSINLRYLITTND